jgi:hypothetical protein
MEARVEQDLVLVALVQRAKTLCSEISRQKAVVLARNMAVVAVGMQTAVVAMAVAAAAVQ